MKHKPITIKKVMFAMTFAILAALSILVLYFLLSPIPVLRLNG